MLLEQHDFAKGTSSRSTKMIHGGVRYLRQGNVTLVFETLCTKSLLMQDAPHLFFNQAFLVPYYDMRRMAMNNRPGWETDSVSKTESVWISLDMYFLPAA